MIIKSILAVAAMSAAISSPLAVPMAIGIPVSLVLGPVAISSAPETPFDVDFSAACLIDECPLVELRYGAPGEESFRIGL
tara:strand:- start:34126 stop:34365 length:240 start_codon:yes stop_codon:yes gene_type:complete